MGTPQIPSVDSDTKLFPSAVMGALGNKFVASNTSADIAPGGTPYVQLHNSGSESSLHLTNIDGFTAAYVMGIGKDVPGVGLQVSNKAQGPGAVFTQTSTVPDDASPALFVAQQSAKGTAAFFHQQVAGAAPLIEVGVTVGQPTADQKLMRWFTLGNHLSGDVSAADGTLRWIDPVLLWNQRVQQKLTLSNGTGAGAPAVLQITDPGLNAGIIEASNVQGTLSQVAQTYWSPTGDNRYWAARWVAAANIFQLQTAGPAVKGQENFGVVMQAAQGALGFFGVAPVGRQGVSAAATDAASTQALVNSLRTALTNLGLVATA